MARIRLLEDYEMEPDIAKMVEGSAAAVGSASAMSLRSLAHRPDILRSFSEFYAKLQTEGLLSRKLIELVRLAIAQVNQCPN